MSTIRVLIVPPNALPYPAEIEHSLAGLQKIVGGDIEVLYPFTDSVGVVCNESGKLLELPLNRALWDESGHLYDIIAGTFFLVGLDIDNFSSIPDKLLEKYAALFRNPENFIQINGKIHAIPYEPTSAPV